MRAHSARAAAIDIAAAAREAKTMKRTSVACIAALLAIAAVSVSVANAASARSPEAMTTGDSATIVSDLEINGLVRERSEIPSDRLRPHYGAPECTTDAGHGYAWPCNRPGRNF